MCLLPHRDLGVNKMVNAGSIVPLPARPCKMNPAQLIPSFAGTVRPEGPSFLAQGGSLGLARRYVSKPRQGRLYA